MKSNRYGEMISLEKNTAFRHSALTFAGGVCSLAISLPIATMLDDIPASADSKSEGCSGNQKGCPDVDRTRS
jgi:hypothetical protein